MKPRYKSDKRQKEVARKQKQDRKKQARLIRKDQPAAGPDGDGSASAE